MQTTCLHLSSLMNYLEGFLRALETVKLGPPLTDFTRCFSLLVWGNLKVIYN